ncbi:NADH dehydrogenase [ubiquinone] 1 beta subcomplex subunit 8, mitochondrial-like [Centruroides sculpturatus]|uniref:NADH dehydrogenase [ubiquinone] 1 beta subcomplex subunit 8, mitochondrial-like n=1 Tax=Centruroides sculpturatus TaxID=218467 RepID=UPI000C6D8813|nr:NADH dehydrogenase [ubiquinone] 1 beta subcomplex subunit 8, mitochondrial-like [Centruroides sculpturatus]
MATLPIINRLANSRYLICKNKVICASLTTTPICKNWNKDWKPGPFPTTEKERRAAAEKYGLLYEDYEPYPDDGFGKGDYPKLPTVSGDARDPYEPFDFPALKRNFCEPLHAEADLLTDTRFNANQKFLIPVWKQCLCFLGAVAGFTLLYFVSEPFELSPPVLPKQYPKKDVVHYTFETAN